jgi:thiol-disulfide isomerase/thioredoxin
LKNKKKEERWGKKTMDTENINSWIGIATLVLLILFMIAFSMAWISTRKSLNSIVSDKHKAGSPMSQATVKLYSADWCPACKMFLPKWKELEQKFNGNVKFIKMDCTENAQKIIKEIKFKNDEKFLGYPTITISKGNEEESFIGLSDTVDQIIEKINNFLSK